MLSRLKSCASYSLLLCASSLFFLMLNLQPREPLHGLNRFTKLYPAHFFELPCLELARATPEPYSADYIPTGSRVDVGGPVWSFYQYEGDVRMEDLKKAEKASAHPLVWIKILNGRLYYRRKPFFARQSRGLEVRKIDVLSGILTALALFKIPDLDMVFDPDDFLTPPGGPLFQNCGNNATGEMLDGFTLPYAEAIQRALGPTQMDVMSACLDQKYPLDERTPKIVWRGRSRQLKNKIAGGEQLGPREKAIVAGWDLGELADIRATSYDGHKNRCATWSNITVDGSCPTAGDHIQMEDYNKYAFVLDIDGLGWSRRLSVLVLGNTPILKQKTRYPDFMMPHVDDSLIAPFEADFSNFRERVREVFNERSISPTQYHQNKIKQMRKFAKVHLTHFGIARAIAYVLTCYADKITWVPRMEFGYKQVKSWDVTNPSLPKEFMDTIRSRD